MKKLAAITVASTILLSSLTPMAFGETLIPSVPAQSSIVITSTDSNTPAPLATASSETTTTSTSTVETTTTIPAATTWVTKLDIPADSPFYPLLRALEQLQQLLTSGQDQKAQLATELAAKRVSEAQYLAAKAKIDEATDQTTEQIEKLTEQTTKLMEEAQKKLDEAQKLAEQLDEEQATEKLDTIKHVNQHRIEVLSKVYLKVPSTAKPSILKNLIKFGATEAQIKALNEQLQGPATTTETTDTQTPAINTMTTTATTPTVTKTQETDNKQLELRLPPGQQKKLGDDKQGSDKSDKDEGQDKDNHGKGQEKKAH